MGNRKKAASIAAIGVATLAAYAATSGPTVSVTGSVTVAAAPAATLLPPSLVDPAACNTLICAPAASPPFDPRRCNVAADPLLRDLAYFANDWFFLEKQAGAAPLPLGGGWTNSRVVRDADGTFFAGVVEKVVDGVVTDVVVAFTGANTADDFASAPAFIAGEDTPQLRRAVALYQSVLDDPRYHAATFRVTGFSLGAGLTQFLLAYTLSRNGEAFVDRRATFAAFGVPGWSSGAARRFGVSEASFAGRFTEYTPVNDAVRLLGVSRMGTRHLLAAYTPIGTLPSAPVNDVVAHSPYPYMAAFGLPDWLGDRKAATAATIEREQALPTDPDYGSPGRVAATISGDAASNGLVGSERDDVIAGGGGGDFICGGGGADRFVYAEVGDSTPGQPDTISDFGDVRDILDLGGVAAAARINTLSFVGAADFTGTGQVRAYADGADTVVAVNLRDDLAPDLVIRLAGAPAIGVGSLILSARR